MLALIERFHIEIHSEMVTLPLCREKFILLGLLLHDTSISAPEILRRRFMTSKSQR